jgi:hypothetical protein
MSITKEEIYDVDMLEQLLKHDGITLDTKNSLRKYKKRRANGNHVALSYDYGKGVRDLKKGRLYVQPWIGLSAVPSDIRAALGAKYYNEIDMENSQPVLLNQIAEKEGISHDAISEFITERKDVLEKLQKDNNMTRDEAKQVCFRVFYGALVDQHPLFPAMRKELQALALAVIKNHSEFVVVAQKSKEAKIRDPSLHINQEGSVLAHYAQHVETTILLCIDEFLKSKGYSMDVLQHDGGMVRKKNNESIPLSLLKEAEDEVFNQMGFKITLTIKPLVHSFLFGSTQSTGLVPQNIEITDSWAAEQFVKIVGDRLRRVGSELYILNSDGFWEAGEFPLRCLIEEYESQLTWKQYNPMGMLVTKNYGSFTININKLIVQTKVKAKEGELPVQFAYKHAEPHEQPLEVLNRFNDLLRIVSGNKPELQNYLLKWIAHIIQKPLELPGVGIVLSGGKGIGKDTTFDILLKHVFGDLSAVNYDTNEQFFEKHDTGRKGKLLVKVEEANRELCKKNADKLKGFVTAKLSTFNAKNEKPVSVPNKCRFIFTTNKGNPLDFSDGERRYVILACSSEMKGNTSYFDSTYDLLDNPEAGRTIGDFLEKVDLTGYDPRVLPLNSYQSFVVENEDSSEKRFFNQWDGEETRVSDLYSSYKEFCIENNLPYAHNALSFANRFTNFFRDNLMGIRRTKQGINYFKMGVPT